jgi:hypothetical protein
MARPMLSSADSYYTAISAMRMNAGLALHAAVRLANAGSPTERETNNIANLDRLASIWQANAIGWASY